MPVVRVQLEDGQYIRYEYSSTVTTHELASNVCCSLFGEESAAYIQLGGIGVWEVCQENIQRRTRSYERVADIVATWDPAGSQAYLRLEQGGQPRYDNTQVMRLIGLSATYSSSLHNKLHPCVIDIYDQLFHLRTTEYNGVWRALDLADIDVYETNSPETVVLRSQVAHEQLPDQVDRMLEIHTTVEQAEQLKTLVYTIRTQRLMAPQTYSFNPRPLIGPPPSIAVLPPRSALRELKHQAASTVLQLLADISPVEPTAAVPSYPDFPDDFREKRASPIKPSPHTTAFPGNSTNDFLAAPSADSKKIPTSALLITPPASPAVSEYGELSLLPPPVPPKDVPRRKARKRVARRICPVIEIEMDQTIHTS